MYEVRVQGPFRYASRPPAAPRAESTQSGQNAELVRRIIGSMNAGRIDQALRELTEDFAMDRSNSIGPLKGIYRGSEGVREFRSDQLDTGATVRSEPLEVIDVDDSQVIVVNRVQMRGPGVYVEDTDAQLWEVRGGKAAGITLYRSKDEALEAARLRE